LTLSTYMLLSTRAWTGEPQWSEALAAVTDVDLTGIVAGTLLTVLVALVLHPLQFTMIQILEGYWGPSRVAVWLAARRIRHHRDKVNALDILSIRSHMQVEERPRAGGEPVHEDDVTSWWAQHEADRARRSYPMSYDDVMPTALGNVLRRYEDEAGRPYGLSILAVAPHLALLAPREHVDFLQDQRTQLDLATRLCVTAGLFACLSTVILAPSGWWLMLATVPYLFSVAFYHGACTVAHDYGTALKTLIDLNRGELYQRLRLPMPPDITAEREKNRSLEKILAERALDELIFDVVVKSPKSLWNRIRGN
jgi:hypothetical protein